MNVTKTTRIHSMTLALSFPLVLMLFAADAECAQASQKSSEELLLEIMDLHSELVINETFLAQAKMLGAYLEAAQPLEESKKIKIYAKVLDILSKIEASPIEVQPIATEEESGAQQKTFEGEQAGKTVYEPGAALLEIFKLTGYEDSFEDIPDLPVIRTYWKRDLACSSVFLLPERLEEVGEGSAYAGKFSFYYEAKQPGKYSFTIQHNRNNACVLKIGGSNIVEAVPKKQRSWSSESDSVQQGLCNLAKGFHRIEFWLVSQARHERYREERAGFQVKILTPDAFDAVPITKDMMLLKKK